MEPSENKSDPSVVGSKKHIEQYEFIKQVGEGAFGNVYLAREKETKNLVAIKALEKAHIVKFEKTESVQREKAILNMFAKHPNVIRLDCVFQVNKDLTSMFRINKTSTLYLRIAQTDLSATSSRSMVIKKQIAKILQGS